MPTVVVMLLASYRFYELLRLGYYTSWTYWFGQPLEATPYRGEAIPTRNGYRYLLYFRQECFRELGVPAGEVRLDALASYTYDVDEVAYHRFDLLYHAFPNGQIYLVERDMDLATYFFRHAFTLVSGLLGFGLFMDGLAKLLWG